MTATSADRPLSNLRGTENEPLRQHSRAWYRMLARDRFATIAGIVLLLIVAAVIFAPLLTEYDPEKAQSGARLLRPSGAHWLGTDELGRDVLSRILHGGRISLTIGFLAVGLGLGIGGSLGLISGYFQRLDNPIMRVMDIILALPGILLAIAIVAALGPGVYEVMIAVGIGSIPIFARVTRSAVLSTKSETYVEAAQSVGANDFRIIMRHILPNSFAPVLVYATLQLATAILSASILSFLGLGPQPPTPEWGAMVAAGRRYMTDTPHVVLAPGFAIFMVILCFNILGDGLRDALDPSLHER
jgi:ABC-type dipeptide/oligopeptide/nickel transport system permease subunit